MSRLWVLMAFSVVLATGPRAQEVVDATEWAFGLPVVEAKKAQIGVGKYLGGATLLLMAPGSFGGYWPDYGYAWNSVAEGGYCNAIARDQVRSKADLGRVRVFAKKAGEEDTLVGVEVLPETVGESSMDRDAGGGESAGLTMKQICGVMDDAALTTGLEYMVRYRSGAFERVPVNGVWKKRAEPMWEGTFEEAGIVWPMWFGQVVDMAEGNGVQTWKLGDKKKIVWTKAGSGWWSERIANVEHALRMELDGGAEGLLVAKKAGDGGEYWVPPESLTVNEGMIEGGDALRTLEDVGEVEIWWMKSGELVASLDPMQQMWLVTEFAIPSRHLAPDIRTEVFETLIELN